ncbi:MAG: hypothetical protein AAB436_02280 [Patescibacteria group bacterium]
MTGERLNGDSSKVAPRLDRIDEVLPKVTAERKAAILAARSIAKTEIEADENRKEERAKKRPQALEATNDKVRLMKPEDFLGREHFLAAAYGYAVDNPDKQLDPMKQVRMASDAYGKLTSIQYSSYHKSNGRYILRTDAYAPARGPLGIAIANRDEVGLDAAPSVISKSGAPIADENGMLVSDVILFADKYDDPEKPLPIPKQMTANNRAVITRVGIYLDAHVGQDL